MTGVSVVVEGQGLLLALGLLHLHLPCLGEAEVVVDRLAVDLQPEGDLPAQLLVDRHPFRERLTRAVLVGCHQLVVGVRILEDLLQALRGLVDLPPGDHVQLVLELASISPLLRVQLDALFAPAELALVARVANVHFLAPLARLAVLLE